LFQLANLQQVHILQRSLFIAVIVGLFAVQTFLRFQSDIIQDAAWFIYVANQLLHGKTLYTDILEVNPPLGMWLIVPIVWLAEKINLDSVIAVDATLLAMSAGLLWYCNRLLRFYDGISIQSRRLMLIFLAVFILYFPASLFAEREHFMVLLFLPWLFLRIIPNASTQLRPVERIAVGMLAAAAICIKPQSVFTPILVELVLVMRSRDLKSPVNIENAAAALFVLLYGASIFFFAPKFLTEMLTLGTKAYVPFFGYGPSLILLNALWALIATLIAYLIRRRLAFLNADTRLMDGLLAAALGFIISYFIQMRGFGYQMMPADILVNFAGVCAAITLWQIERKFSFYILAPLFIPAILLAGSPQTYLNNFDPIDKIMARNAPDAKSIFIASTQIGHGFPYVQQRNLVWASRLPTQWLAPYIESKWQAGQIPEDKITRDALDWTVSDLIQFKPDIVMIDVSKDQYYIASGKFEYLQFWANDKRFAEVWSHYKFRETVSGMDVFTRVGP
jgi:hypothetical protein